MNGRNLGVVSAEIMGSELGQADVNHITSVAVISRCVWCFANYVAAFSIRPQSKAKAHIITKPSVPKISDGDDALCQVPYFDL